jgi:hypothetical protein
VLQAVDQPSDPINQLVAQLARGVKVSLTPEQSSKLLLAGVAALSAFSEALMDIAGHDKTS